LYSDGWKQTASTNSCATATKMFIVMYFHCVPAEARQKFKLLLILGPYYYYYYYYYKCQDI